MALTTTGRLAKPRSGAALWYRFYDFVVVVGPLFATSWLYGGTLSPPVLVWMGTLAPLAFAIFAVSGTYSHHPRFAFDRHAGRLFLAWAITLLAAFMSAYFMRIIEILPRTAIGIWIVATTVLLPLGRLLPGLGELLGRRVAKEPVNALVVGLTVHSRHVAARVQAGEETALRVVALLVTADTDVQDRDSELNRLPVYRDLARIERICTEHDIAQVLVTLPADRAQHVVPEIMDRLDGTSILISFLPTPEEVGLFRSATTEIGGQHVIDLTTDPLAPHQQLIKWIEDMVLAALIVTLTAPLMLVIAAIVKCTSRGPVFFVQLRHGQGGRPIRVYKYRTMRHLPVGESDAGQERDEKTGLFRAARTGDPRITHFGRFLRNSSLDELPQFINVLQGRMSIVGPRPHAIRMNQDYARKVTGMMRRHSIKPGITGLAQIKGFRGSVDSTGFFQRRIDYDVEYIRNWSLWLDLRIIAVTLVRGFWNREP